ncbi:hypothetical protein Ahia01_000501300 [Argonauta hians]
MGNCCNRTITKSLCTGHDPECGFEPGMPNDYPIDPDYDFREEYGRYPCSMYDLCQGSIGSSDDSVFLDNDVLPPPPPPPPKPKTKPKVYVRCRGAKPNDPAPNGTNGHLAVSLPPKDPCTETTKYQGALASSNPTNNKSKSELKLPSQRKDWRKEAYLLLGMMRPAYRVFSRTNPDAAPTQGQASTSALALPSRSKRKGKKRAHWQGIDRSSPVSMNPNGGTSALPLQPPSTEEDKNEDSTISKENKNNLDSKSSKSSDVDRQ